MVPEKHIVNNSILKLAIGILALLLFLEPAYAENKKIQYKLVDTGVLNHNIHGKGIEIRIKPSSMPKGGLNGEILLKEMANICKCQGQSKTLPLGRRKTSPLWFDC